MTDKIILAGNPNVGKSTLFNRLTGLRQHTGNWAGKTVGSAHGYMRLGEGQKVIIDTPGTYSLVPSSPDEELARDSICGEECDIIIVVCDGCCLQRSLFLALQIMERRSNVIICVNLMDEARKKGISIDFDRLSEKMGVPVLGLSAGRGRGIDALLDFLGSCNFEDSTILEPRSDSMELKKKAEELCRDTVSIRDMKKGVMAFDAILTHRIWAWPIMLGLLFAILWLSISGANYPSELLSRLFAWLGELMRQGLARLGLSETIISPLMDGVYGTTVWVISVMLPPMAIFFPLFTLLEDLGLLPRIAFNMDGIFKKCGSCGKQALTMCMGLGCNAVGVTGCRIIASPKEKLIGILTNSFMPCNGRFPTLILLGSLLFPARSSLLAATAVLAIICLGAILTFISSKLLALSLHKEQGSLFTLELPPYRKPKIAESLIRSLLDRTVYVLLRAIKAAAPAGLIIWLLANMRLGDESLLQFLQGIFETPARIFGLDGAIMLGFILGLPANEIVMPIIMMCYLSGTALSALPAAPELGIILSEMGWTGTTVICLMVFTLLHWPCATTLMTIKKECGKMRWVLLAAVLPTIWGLGICLMIKLFSLL